MTTERATRWAAALVTALLVGACTGEPVEVPSPNVPAEFVPETPRAAPVPDGGVVLASGLVFPSALVVDRGRVYIGELQTGRILQALLLGDEDSLAEIARLDVAGVEQRGLLGLAIDDDGRMFASWVRASDDRLVVGEVLFGERASGVAPAGGPATKTRLIWEGPASQTLANGGRIAVLPDGGIVIALGDLLDRSKVSDPDEPNGKVLRLDADAEAYQTPEVISAGWNNPFAFDITDDGRIWVADNAPDETDERLARADLDGMPTAVGGLGDAEVAPSGLAWLDDQQGFVVCGWLSRALQRYVPDLTGVPRAAGEPFGRGCAFDVAAVTATQVVYATEDAVIRLDVPTG